MDGCKVNVASNVMRRMQTDATVHSDLNVDCVVEILRRCSLVDLASASCVSTLWNQAASRIAHEFQLDDISLIGSHRLVSSSVMLARSLLSLENTFRGQRTASFVDVHESHGHVAMIDDEGKSTILRRNGSSLIVTGRIPGHCDDMMEDLSWRVYVLGATKNILTILPHHSCTVYLENHGRYKMKHRFWPSSLVSQRSLEFCMGEDPQYLYVGCDAGKVLQLDVFNQGAVSCVYRISSAESNITSMLVREVPQIGTSVLIAATLDDSKIPFITLYSLDDEESAPSTSRCPSNSRYKKLVHLDLCIEGTTAFVLGTCETMLVMWKIIQDPEDSKIRIVYLSHAMANLRTMSAENRGVCFLSDVHDDRGNVYACAMDSDSIRVYKIHQDTKLIEQIRHVPVFGSDPMENIRRAQENITAMSFKSYPFVFLAEATSGVIVFPPKDQRFSRPSSFLHVAARFL